MQREQRRIQRVAGAAFDDAAGGNRITFFAAADRGATSHAHGAAGRHQVEAGAHVFHRAVDHRDVLGAPPAHLTAVGIGANAVLAQGDHQARHDAARRIVALETHAVCRPRSLLEHIVSRAHLALDVAVLDQRVHGPLHHDAVAEGAGDDLGAEDAVVAAGDEQAGLLVQRHEGMAALPEQVAVAVGRGAARSERHVFERVPVADDVQHAQSALVGWGVAEIVDGQAGDCGAMAGDQDLIEGAPRRLVEPRVDFDGDVGQVVAAVVAREVQQAVDAVLSSNFARRLGVFNFR